MCEPAPTRAAVGRDRLEYVVRRKTSAWRAGDAVAVAVSAARLPRRSAAGWRAKSVRESVTLSTSQSRTTSRTRSQPSFLASETQTAIWNRSKAG